MSSFASVSQSFYRLGAVQHLEQWLNSMPHPGLVCEIAPTHVAVARWTNNHGGLGDSAMENLPEGAVVPSPIEPNLVRVDVVRSALSGVFRKVSFRGPTALLIPDPVVRVFILPFETFPRRADEAVPLLRWRLKKSVPFEVEETVVSSMRQGARNGSLEMVAAIARQRIVREYEEVVEAAGMVPGVVMSSTLACLPLLEERGATLLVRMNGRNLTTVIVHGLSLCVYRSTEMAADTSLLEPQAMLDEVFPAIAYYQDTWGGSVDRARVAGLGAREEIFRRALAGELKCSAGSLADAEGPRGLSEEARSLMNQELDPLVGWMMNGG